MTDEVIKNGSLFRSNKMIRIQAIVKWQEPLKSKFIL